MTQPTPSWHGAYPNLPDFRSTLHERYRHLRDVAPVSITPRGMWRLTRHEDCLRLLRRTKVGVRTTEGELLNADESKMPRAFMLDQDAPNHTRLRKLVSRYFTPKAMRALDARVMEVTASLIGAMDEDEIELVTALAKPLPTTIICEMMGVPADDRLRFTEWTNDLTYVLLGTAASPEQQQRAATAFGKMMAYISERIEERRDSLSDDLISVLIRAEEDGDRLSSPELIWQCIGLILAGFETTTGLIANGMRQLLLHPDEWKRLQDDPGLIDTTVEECLRFDPSVLGAIRVMHEDAEFGGYVIPQNARVFAAIAAANRDPDVFDKPEEFDVRRDPNPHIGFGGGVHVCLGAFLARLEGRAAIGALAKRLPDLELVNEEAIWSSSLLRIPGELRVRRRA